MDDPVLVEVKDHVCVISLNRPKVHNAINDEMYESLNDITRLAADDPQVRVIVLRGEGQSFSSGKDTAVLGKHHVNGRINYMYQAQEVNRRFRACRKPVIAALKGHVLGKGFEMALAADMRFAARGTKLGLPEINFGLITDNGGLPSAVALAGPSRAKYLLMTGDSIEAEQALAWGLVDRLVEIAVLDEFVSDVALKLASRSPLAVGLAKEIVNQINDAAVAVGSRTEMLAELALYATEDQVEARVAHDEGRPAVFRSQ